VDNQNYDIHPQPFTPGSANAEDNRRKVDDNKTTIRHIQSMRAV